MKTILVVLFILNVNGGNPIAVESFDTMDECKESFRHAIETPALAPSFRFSCVPIMRKQP